MPTEIVVSSIRSQGAGIPTHTAAYGMLYVDQNTGDVYQQIETPGGAGNVWRLLSAPRLVFGRRGTSLAQSLALTED